jgi:hypothetical protein
MVGPVRPAAAGRVEEDQFKQRRTGRFRGGIRPVRWSGRRSDRNDLTGAGLQSQRWSDPLPI